jgi:hypothetical protein
LSTSCRDREVGRCGKIQSVHRSLKIIGSN